MLRCSVSLCAVLVYAAATSSSDLFSQTSGVSVSSALQYDPSDPLPPAVTSADVDKVRLAYVAARLGKSQADGFATLSPEAKDRLFEESMMSDAERQTQTQSNRPTPKLSKQIARSWRIDADKLMMNERYIEDLNECLDEEPVRSSKIVQDFLQRHKDKLDKLTPLGLLELQARVISVYLRAIHATGMTVFLAISKNPMVRTEALPAFFANDAEMSNFFATHVTEVERVQGLRDQLLLFTLRLFQTDTEKGWGDLTVMRRQVGPITVKVAFEPAYAGDGRGLIQTVFGPPGVRLFDEGRDEPGVSDIDTEEKKRNHRRLFAAASVATSLNSLTNSIKADPSHPVEWTRTTTTQR